MPSRRSLRAPALGLLTLLWLALPAPSHAAKLAGVELPDNVNVGGDTLVLNGAGLRSKMIFKVYVAGLYLPAQQHDAAKILSADEPRQVIMQFVRSVDAEKICGGWQDGLKANTPGASADLKSKFDTLCGLMQDTEDGSQYIYTYVPGTGTEIQFEGKALGTIEGKDFADALWGCWIGSTPPSADFKSGLLGN